MDSVGRAAGAGCLVQRGGKEGGCFVIFGEHFHEQREETGEADGAWRAVRACRCAPVPEPLGQTPGLCAGSCWGPTGVMP